MSKKTIGRIERLNYWLSGALIFVSAFLLPIEVTIGLACGAGISCVNFTFLRRLLTRVATETAASGNPSPAVLFIIPKMMVMIAIIFVIIRFLPVAPWAVATGFGIFLVSVAIEVTRFTLVGVEPNGDAPQNPIG